MAEAKTEVEKDIGSIREVLLEFVEGENEGVEIRISPPRTLVVGRSEECDIYLGEKKISRKHCNIVVEKGHVEIKDLQSTNGTYVNKNKVDRTKVTEEDRIQLGTTVIKLKFEYEGGAAEQSLSEGLLSKTEFGASIDGESTSNTDDNEVSLPGIESPSGLIDAISKNDDSDQSRSDSYQKIDLSSEDAGFEKFENDQPMEDFDLDVSADESFEDINLTPAKIDKDVNEKPRPFTGDLSTMSLADLLQNLSQNVKSGLLKIQGPAEGILTLEQGKLLQAQVGEVYGEKALYRMLSWQKGGFELIPLSSDFSEKNIVQPLKDSIEKYLMEGFRQQDELKKFQRHLPAPTEKLSIKPSLKAPLSKLHPRVLDVFQLVLNQRNLGEILDESEHSDLETSKILYYLLKKNYIE